METMFIMNVSNIEAETKEPIQVTAWPILESVLLMQSARRTFSPAWARYVGQMKIPTSMAFVKENNKEDIEPIPSHSAIFVICGHPDTPIRL